jgi:hypothetical protein
MEAIWSNGPIVFPERRGGAKMIPGKRIMRRMAAQMGTVALRRGFDVPVTVVETD